MNHEKKRRSIKKHLVSDFGGRAVSYRLLILSLLVATSGVVSSCLNSAPIFSQGSGDGGQGGARESGGTNSGGSSSGGADSGGSGGESASGGTDNPSGGADNPSAGGGMGGQMLVPGPVGDSLSIDVGDSHTCGIVDTELYCWGNNQLGALGLGDEVTRLVPTRLAGDTVWQSVGCGNDFSCAIGDGVLHCWGAGSSGQLGTGQFSSQSSPETVSLPETIDELSVGHDHVCVVLTDGTLWCWGNNTEGQLGQNDPFPGPGVNSASPIQVGSALAWASVSAGQGHTCAISSQGNLYCWGRNSRGELGLGDEAEGQLRTPQLVGADADWSAVAAGQNHTCALKENGSLYCWGGNAHGQAGPSIGVENSTPQQLEAYEDIRLVTTDTFHTCLLDDSNRALCMGRNLEGQLGNGTDEDAPQGTVTIPDVGFAAIAAGRFHTCAVLEGAFLCTGENSDGRLGNGDRLRRAVFSATLQP